MSAKKKPTILLVAPYGFNDRLTNFIEFVTGRLLAREGFRVIALTRREKGEPEEETVEGIRVMRYLFSREGAMHLLKLFWRERPDIVHVHNLRNNQIGSIAALLAQMCRRPLFFTEYGLPHDHYLADDRDNPFARPLAYDNVIGSFGSLVHHIVRSPARVREHIRNYLFHYPLFAARTVVFVSKHNIPVAQKLGIRDARYIPHIADSVRWNIRDTQDDAVFLDRIRMLPSGTKALFVGQLKERKGWETYLRAIPHVSRDIISTFLMITPSSDRSEFDPLVKELGVENRVELFVQVPGTVLKQLFDIADMLVVPSSYEGFGLAPLEAFEAGKPVIASRVEALTDFLVDGENALLVPPKDPEALAHAIERMATDIELRTRLTTGGAATLQKMRSSDMHEKWLRLYRDALKH